MGLVVINFAHSYGKKLSIQQLDGPNVDPYHCFSCKLCLFSEDFPPYIYIWISDKKTILIRGYLSIDLRMTIGCHLFLHKVKLLHIIESDIYKPSIIASEIVFRFKEAALGEKDAYGYLAYTYQSSCMSYTYFLSQNVIIFKVNG